VRLGYRAGRFRNAYANLPAHATPAKWDACFENAIAVEDCCRLTLFLSEQQHAELIEAVPDDAKSSWPELVNFMADGLSVESGILFPTLKTAVDPDLSPPWFRLDWNDLRLPPRKGLLSGQIAVNDTAERLHVMNLNDVVEIANPATEQPSCVVDASHQDRLEATGLTTWTPAGFLILAIAGEIRKAAPAFVHIPFTEYLLARLHLAFPELVSAVRQKFELPILTAILRNMIEEEVSVRDLATILEAIATAESAIKVDPRRTIAIADVGLFTYLLHSNDAAADFAVRDYTEIARRALSRHIGSKYSRGTNTLVVYLFDAETERRLAAAERLSAEDREQVRTAYYAECAHLPPTAMSPVLLVSRDVRWRLREELSPSRVTVVSYDELPPELNIQPVARISPRFAAST
jgi:type III secretion protein V